MLEEVAGVAWDVFGPDPGPDLDRLFDKKNPDQLRVPLSEPGSFKNRLNLSGWFDEEVVAGGLITQGKAQSLISLIVGWGLIDMIRSPRCKSLPREFCVAVTAERVVALALSAWSEGEDGIDAVVKVKRGERGSWSRGSVRIDLDARTVRSGMKGGMLELDGLERFPINWGSGSQAEEVVELLARG
jgi:hypothetical protein